MLTSLRQDIPEYYPIGHDEPVTLFDDALEEATSPEHSVSLMFAGSGDGRNLFMTLLFLAYKAPKKRVFNDAHITVLDYNPAVIARTLIMFSMLAEYGIAKRVKAPGYADKSIMMSYLYAGYVIPAAANELIQTHIRRLIAKLETDQKIFDWLFVPAATRYAVVRILRQWQSPLRATYHKPRMMRVVIMKRMNWMRAGQVARDGKPREYRPGLEHDDKTLSELGVLLPSQSFAERHDPPLVGLMEAYETGSKPAAAQLAKYIDTTWATNVTLLSLDLDSVDKQVEASPWYWESSIEGKVPHIEIDPCELARRFLQLLPTSTTKDLGGVLDSIGRFFDRLAVYITMFSRGSSSQLMIEVLVGEMTDVMERLRWNCLEARSGPAGGIDPSTFPRI
jgi:hypothetical protein